MDKSKEKFKVGDLVRVAYHPEEWELRMIREREWFGTGVVLEVIPGRYFPKCLVYWLGSNIKDEDRLIHHHIDTLELITPEDH